MAAMDRDHGHHYGATVPKDPLLDLIIQKYTQAARDSIRGPVALKADLQRFARSPPDYRNQKDYRKYDPSEESKSRETSLDGHTVACFNVGGEKRLCFSELVQVVLKDYNSHDIYKRKDELLIFCSQCSPSQLHNLKMTGVLPWTCTSNNLITKSDAYRLVGALFGPRAGKGEPTKRSPISFEVYHECFGGCIGVFDPEMYLEMNSTCIRCTECNGMFSTKKFVSHNHMSFDEVHTCHWGFDSSRWRSYLMLVEQKPSRELLTLWASIKAKFDGIRSKANKSFADPKQDLDFVSYIQSPDQKKALVSPIESLRSRETRGSSTAEYRGPEYMESRDSEKMDSRSSAFHPWSPNPHRSLVSKPPLRTDNHPNNRFIYPEAQHSSLSKQHPYPNHVYPGNPCGCGPNSLSSSSPLYMGCHQCKNAAQAASCSGLHMLAQKASEIPGEMDVKPKVEPGMPSSCACEQCKRAHRDSIHRDSLEGCVEDILRNFTADLKLTTSTQEIARVLAVEMRQLSLGQSEEIRNQRLQTEIHLVKTEYSKKLNEALDAKAHLEQELEIVQRERQKDIARYNRLTWEFTQEVEKQKLSAGEKTEIQLEALQKEIRLLKSQLEQSMIDRQNLHKQLTWQVSKQQKKDTSTKMEVDKWTPFPTIGRKFSDSESDAEDSTKKEKMQTDGAKHTSERKSPVIPESNVTPSSPMKARDGPGAPKRKLESDRTEQRDSDEDEDIEVEE